MLRVRDRRAGRGRRARASNQSSPLVGDGWPGRARARRCRGCWRRRGPWYASARSSLGHHPSVRNSRTASSSSRAVGRPYGVASSGRGAGSGAASAARHASGGEQLDEVPLLFGHAAADGGELDRADPARQVDVGLEHAADAPGERLRDEPPVQRVAVDGPTAGRLVGGDELVDRPEPADLERCAEAPRLEAEPGEVLERVADGGPAPSR